MLKLPIIILTLLIVGNINTVNASTATVYWNIPQTDNFTLQISETTDEINYLYSTMSCTINGTNVGQTDTYDTFYSPTIWKPAGEINKINCNGVEKQFVFYYSSLNTFDWEVAETQILNLTTIDLQTSSSTILQGLQQTNDILYLIAIVIGLLSIIGLSNQIIKRYYGI